MTRQSFNEARARGRVAQGRSQTVDGSVQAMVEIDEGVRGPESLANPLTGHYLSRMFQQHYQDLEWLVLKLYFIALLAQLAQARINLKDTEAKSRCRLHSGFPIQIWRLLAVYYSVMFQPSSFCDVIRGHKRHDCSNSRRYVQMMQALSAVH
jgi:hypothetical protein